MYRYDNYDQRLVDERVEQFRDQVSRRLAGELTEDEFKPLRLMNGLYLQLHAYMLRVAIPYGTLSSRSCASSPTSPAATTRATAISPRARTSSSTGSSWRRRPTSWPSWPRSRCTPSRPAATASATSPPTISPAPPPTRSRIRASGARSSASGRPSIRNSPSCRASSRSPSPARRTTAPRCRCTTSACACMRNESGEVGFEVYVGGGQGRTPIIAKTHPRVPAEAASAVLSRGDPARLQPLGRRDNIYKARIKILVHAVGAAQVRPDGRGGMAADPATALWTCRPPRSSASAPTSRRRPSRPSPVRRPSMTRSCAEDSCSPAGCAATSRRTSSRATPSSPCR